MENNFPFSAPLWKNCDTCLLCKNITQNFTFRTGPAETWLYSHCACYIHFLWWAVGVNSVTLNSLVLAKVMDGREKGRQRKWGRESDGRERASWWVQFSCAFTSTHPRQTVPSGREFNLWEDEPNLKASFFGVCLPSKCSWLPYVRRLYGQHVLWPRNPLHFCLTGSSLSWCILTEVWMLHRDSSEWKIWSHSCFKFFLT